MSMPPPQEPLLDPQGRPLTKACPVCGTQIALDAPFCPHCGTALRGSGPPGGVIAAGVLAVIVGVLLALLLTKDDGDPTPAATSTVPTIATTTVPTVPTAPVVTTPTVTTPAITTPTVTTPAVTTPTVATVTPTVSTVPPIPTPGTTTTTP